MGIRSDTIEATTADYVERFRTALMAAHSDDYDMETVSTVAHVCAAAIADEVIERTADIVQLHSSLFMLLSSLGGPSEVLLASAEQARVMLDTITPPVFA